MQDLAAIAATAVVTMVPTPLAATMVTTTAAMMTLPALEGEDENV
jgi:hypothetical protein